MREIEFLPDWYIKTQRRKKLLSLQVACSIGLVIFFGGWSVINARSLAKAHAYLEDKRAELKETNERVKERQTSLEYKKKLENQSRVDASLGLNVESARILKLMDGIMPATASLSEIDIKTDEMPIAITTPIVMKTANEPRDITRTLTVLLKGVAPSNEDVAEILDGLINAKFCQNPKLNSSKDKIDGDRVFREFSIEFTIPLDVSRGQL